MHATHSCVFVACVAGGSGCARETFCGEARKGIFASGEAASKTPSRSSRDLRGFLHSRSGQKFARVPTPAGYAGVCLLLCVADRKFVPIALGKSRFVPGIFLYSI